MNRRLFSALTAAFATGLAACSPGYMNASELQSKHQGPSDCEARCVELGMRMGALVLVSDALPGCVCQPKPTAAEAPKPPPVEAPKPDPAPPAASAPIGSDVAVMTAAVAARVVQTQQQKQKQQSYLPN